MPALVQRVSNLVGGYRPQQQALKNRMNEIKKMRTKYIPKMQAASVYAGEERQLALKFRDRSYDLNLKQIQECLHDYSHYNNLLMMTNPEDFDYQALSKCVDQAETNVNKAARSIINLAKSDTLIVNDIEKYEKQTTRLEDRFNKALDLKMINRLAKGMRVQKQFIDEEKAKTTLAELADLHNKTLTLIDTDYNAELQKYLDECRDILSTSNRYRNSVNNLQTRIDTDQNKHKRRLGILSKKQEEIIQQGYVKLEEYYKAQEENNALKEKEKADKQRISLLVKQIKANIKNLNTILPASKKEIIIQNYETVVDEEIVKADNIKSDIETVSKGTTVQVKPDLIQDLNNILETKKEKLLENKKYCHKLYVDQAKDEQTFNKLEISKIKKLIQDVERAKGIEDEAKQVIAMEKIVKSVEELTREIDNKTFLIYSKDEMYNLLDTVNAGAKDEIKEVKNIQKAILNKRKEFIEKETKLRFKIKQEKATNKTTIANYGKNLEAYTTYKNQEALTSTIPSIEEELTEWTLRHREFVRNNLFLTSADELKKIDTQKGKGGNVQQKVDKLHTIKQELIGYEQENADLLQEQGVRNSLDKLYAEIDKKLGELEEKAWNSSDIAKLRQSFINKENELRQKFKEERGTNKETVDKYAKNIEEYTEYKSKVLSTAVPQIEKELVLWNQRFKNFERTNLFVSSKIELKKIQPEKGIDPQPKIDKVKAIKEKLQNWAQENPNQLQDQQVVYNLNVLYKNIDKVLNVLGGKSEEKIEEERVKTLKKAGIRNGVYADSLVKGQVYLSEHGHARYKGMQAQGHVFELVSPTQDGTYQTYNRLITINGSNIVNHLARNIELGQTYLYKGGPGTATYRMDMGNGNLGFELHVNNKVVRGKMKAADIINGIIAIPEDTVKHKDRNFKVPFTKNPDAMRANSNILKKNGQNYTYICKYGFVSFVGTQPGNNFIFCTNQGQQFAINQKDITKGAVQLIPQKGSIYNVKGKIALCRGVDQMGFFNFIPFEDMERGYNKGIQAQYNDIKGGNIQPLTQAQNNNLKEIMNTDKEMYHIFERYFNAINEY